MAQRPRQAHVTLGPAPANGAVELHGHVLGIVDLGAAGSRVADLAAADMAG